MSSEEVIEFRCHICGSILKISPENIVSICEYCGGLNVVSGMIDREDIYVTSSVSLQKVSEEFWRRIRVDIDLKRISDKIRVVSIQGYYVPFWVSRISLDGEIVYTKKQYRNKKIEVIRRREVFSEELNMDIIARRQVKNVALRELVKAYFLQSPEPLKLRSLDEVWWRSNKLNILNIEFDKKEAMIALREEAVDSIRKRWENVVDEIEFYRAEVKKMEEPKLILLPLWEVIYEYRGSLYTAYHEGWSGRPLIFYEPVTIGRRIAYIAGMFASIIMGAFIGSAFSSILLDSSENILFIILFLLFILALLAYRSAKGFVSDVRIEKSWK